MTGTPPLAAQRQAKLVAAAWLERLDGLERRLGDDQIDKLARWPSPRLNGVDGDTLRKNRAVLLERIQTAKRRLKEIAGLKE